MESRVRKFWFISFIILVTWHVFSIIQTMIYYGFIRHSSYYNMLENILSQTMFTFNIFVIINLSAMMLLLIAPQFINYILGYKKQGYKWLIGYLVVYTALFVWGLFIMKSTIETNNYVISSINQNYIQKHAIMYSIFIPMIKISSYITPFFQAFNLIMCFFLMLENRKLKKAPVIVKEE